MIKPQKIYSIFRSHDKKIENMQKFRKSALGDNRDFSTPRWDITVGMMAIELSFSKLSTAFCLINYL